MSRHLYRLLFVALLFTQATTAAAQAVADQPAATPSYVASSVSGTGTATIERAPETLRMEIDVLAKGKDLKDALGKLKQRRKAAEQQLAKLGADTKSIRFGTPRVSSIDNDQQRQMQMMMRQRMAGRGKRRAVDKPAVAPPVTIAVSLVAQWPLKTDAEGADGAEQLLLAAHALEAKVKDADLGGRKAAEELSPEEAELAEESEDDDDQVYYGGQPQAKPGEPRFVYVASISDGQRAQALAKAFERAKADALRLAQAAGAKLGSLQRLSGGNEAGGDPESLSDWGPYEYQMYQRAAQQQPTDDKLEAIGARPGMLKCQVTVSATFALK